jgi:hypothetical protein
LRQFEIEQGKRRVGPGPNVDKRVNPLRRREGRLCRATLADDREHVRHERAGHGRCVPHIFLQLAKLTGLV